MTSLGVGSVATSGVGSVATYCVGSAGGSRLAFLSKFLIRNNLLLKLLKTFSLTLNNNSKLFKKRNICIPSSKFFNSLTKLLCFILAFSIDKCPLYISIKKTAGSDYLLKL